MKVLTNHLTVVDGQAQERFYREVLGMRAIRDGLGYGGGQMALQFEPGAAAPYTPDPLDLYWKIGITLRDLELAVDHLRGLGVAVSDPRQFRDIGYLCHLRDPEGLQIELLQQGFEGNHADAGSGHPVADQATLAHLTLRVTNIEGAARFFGETLGMRLMSVQPVPERQFTLYFYAWGREALPNPDLAAVENREWLWARPYTFIELQHLESADGLKAVLGGEAGFSGFTYGDSTNPQFASASDIRTIVV